MINFFKKLKKSNTIKIGENFFASNFWNHKNYKELWFYQFLKNRNLLNENVIFHFYSVFGAIPKLNHKNVNVFFCGENVNLPAWKKYKNHLLDKVDIALGFNFIEHSNYLRFPLWILYLIPANASFEDIKNIFDSFNTPTQNKRSIKFSLIASHDKNGIRNKIVKEIEKQFDIVHCPGKFKNNTNILKEKYNDDKLKFLQDVVFNICPENSNASGYVTEKIFEAISQGCIPIYWGAESNPEPEILINDSIIFYDPEDSIKVVDSIKNYEFNNIKKYFIKQDAALVVWNWLQKLEELFIQKIKEKTK